MGQISTVVWKCSECVEGKDSGKSPGVPRRMWEGTQVGWEEKMNRIGLTLDTQ